MANSMSEASTLKETPPSSTDVSHQLLGIDWDPRNAAAAAAAQDVNFTVTLPSHLYDVGLTRSRGIHCSSVGLLDPFPRFPCFNNGSFVEHISSFAYSGDGSVANPDVPTNLHSKKNQDVEKDFGGKKRKNLLDSDSFDSRSQLHKVQNVESDEQNSPPLETAEVQVVKDDDKRQVLGGSPWKTNLKEQPQNADAPKEDYIHVRAKRGQATNSHSLAERVRREKISERMRFLQNLVPGCSKITGKAVMLDEIINYVQSLQRQVEFLSMKLATVNPEINFDIEQTVPKYILHSRVGNSAALMFDPGMNISNSHLHGFIPQSLSQSEMAIPSVPSHIYHMSQASGLWEDEFQTIFQMGVPPNVNLNNTEQQPGSMKLG